MNNTIENIDSLTYAMSDEELIELGNKIFQNNKKRHNVTDMSMVSKKDFQEITNCLLTIPLTRKAINSFVKLGFYTREELEEKNRVRYAERKWEQYL